MQMSVLAVGVVCVLIKFHDQSQVSSVTLISKRRHQWPLPRRGLDQPTTNEMPDNLNSKATAM